MKRQSDTLRQALEAMDRLVGKLPAMIDQPEPVATRLDALREWMSVACVASDRGFGGVGCLHVHFSEWQSGIHDAVPCSRTVFVRLLEHEGYLICDGMVSGLVLSEDWYRIAKEFGLERGEKSTF
jgi:hypothetical protein